MTTQTTKRKTVKAKPVVKAGKGRPSAYKSDYAGQAQKLCLMGATDGKLADFFGVSEQTVNAWKLVHPDFLESITRGKDVADAEIAESLFKRAKGYSHPEVHVSNFQGLITLTPLTKHYPPDTPAASLWLRNRQPKLWRDKLEVAGDGGGPLVINLVRFSDNNQPA